MQSMARTVNKRNIITSDDTLNIQCKYGALFASGFTSIDSAIRHMIHTKLGQYKGQDLSDIEFVITNQTRGWFGAYRLLNSGKVVKLP